MTADDPVCPDVGLDIALSKTALAAWLIRHGKVSPKHAMLSQMYKRMAKTTDAFTESRALFVMVSHASMHAHDDGTSVEPELSDVPRCKSRPCKAAAVAEVLTAVYKCDSDRSGHWTRLANSLEPVVAALEAMDLDALESSANAVQSLERAIPGHPEYDHQSTLLPKLDPVELFTRAVLRHPEFPAELASSADTHDPAAPVYALVATMYGGLCLQVVEALRGATDLATKLRAQLRSMLPSHTLRANRQGRPSREWLNQLRRRLREASFSEPEIALLLPDGPLETPEQRRYATERVRKAVGRNTSPEPGTTSKLDSGNLRPGGPSWAKQRSWRQRLKGWRAARASGGSTRWICASAWWSSFVSSVPLANS